MSKITGNQTSKTSQEQAIWIFIMSRMRGERG